MGNVNFAERRRALIGLGSLAIVGVEGAATGRGTSGPAMGTASGAAAGALGSRPDLRWTSVSPMERTILGLLPKGAQATVYVRGTWGPLTWPDRAGVDGTGDRARALIVAQPMVQLLSVDGRRVLRRVTAAHPVAVSAPEDCLVALASIVSGDRLVSMTDARARDAHDVQAALSLSRERAPRA